MLEETTKYVSQNTSDKPYSKKSNISSSIHSYLIVYDTESRMANIYSALILLPANFDLMSGNKIKEYERTHTFFLSFVSCNCTTNKAGRKVIA